MSLKEARAQVVTDLEEIGYKVVDHVPEKVVPPIIIMGTGDPYVEVSETFNRVEFVCHLELFCVTGTATNASATDKLDQMIEQVVWNLGDWNIDGVSAPYMATANGNAYLTSRISITKTINIEGD